MTIIFWFSSQPYHEQDLRPTMNNYLQLEGLKPFLQSVEFRYHGQEVSLESHGVAGLIEFFIRKASHFFIYFLLMGSLFVAFKKVTRLSYSLLFVLSILITIGYAATDEYHQSLTPNRTPYVGDVLIDAAGALCAGIMLVVFYKDKKE